MSLLASVNLIYSCADQTQQWVKVKRLPKHLLINWSNKCLKPLVSIPCSSCILSAVLHFLWHLVSCCGHWRAFSCNIYMLFGLEGYILTNMHLNWENYFCFKSLPVTEEWNLFLGSSWSLSRLRNTDKLNLNEKKYIKLRHNRRQFWALHDFFEKWSFLKRVPQYVYIFLLIDTGMVLLL